MIDLVHLSVVLEHWLGAKVVEEERLRMAKEAGVVRLKLVEVAVEGHLKTVEEADEEQLMKVVGELLMEAAEDLKVSVMSVGELEASSQLAEEALASMLMSSASAPQMHLSSGDLR